MLSNTMLEKLNNQINLEFYSSNMYLQMSSWAESKGFDGCAEFLSKHADEEMQHMKRLFTYVNETGSMARIGAIEAPIEEFDSIKDLFEKVYEHECLITKEINGLAHTAFTNQDYSTFNFLQWYVAEQHEEEKTFKGILDKIEIIGEDGKGLFFIDKEIGQMKSSGLNSSIQAPQP